MAAATTVEPLLRKAATAGLTPRAIAAPSPIALGAAIRAMFWFMRPRLSRDLSMASGSSAS